MQADSVTINQKTYSLHELMLSIQSILTKTYTGHQYWIRCEVSRISLHAQSGHCYLELIDKNDTSIVAQLRAMIWSDKYGSLCQKFESVTNTPIAGGMKILLCCSVNFHPLHGLSLTIHDIEPSFTLGEMARMKNNSITRLKSEGVFHQNKNLSLPIFPGRIAIISVATSRGYHDFITTIIHYQRKFAIRHTLFEAILQGDNAIPSLSGAIKKILSHKNKFDAIAIIRGGAGDAGLSCYDEYSLASLIAQSSIPVITGIGHATNETVSEMVAFKNCITPTAAASFLLDRFDNLYDLLTDNINRLKESSINHCIDQKQSIHHSAERIGIFVRNKIDYQKLSISHLQSVLPGHSTRKIAQHRNSILQSIQILFNIRRYGTYQLALSQLNSSVVTLQSNTRLIIGNRKDSLLKRSDQFLQTRAVLKENNTQLAHLSEKVSLLDPLNTLKRGYSITRFNGHALTDPSQVNGGENIETILAGGTLSSTVKK
jgi:exodeoxyribonuclease VII large subunit